MNTTTSQTGHSADVQIQLNLNGFALAVGQLGPQFLILREPVEHPPADAELVMSIDGKVRRWNVHLPEGISASKIRTKIA